jgi:hypothetical protein
MWPDHSVIGDARKASAPNGKEPEMTVLTKAQPRTPAALIAGVALTAALLGGIAGGIVGTRVQAIVQEAAVARAAEQAKWDAYGTEWERLHREQRSRYLSPRDQAVLEAAKEWEARQREMYPN